MSEGGPGPGQDKRRRAEGGRRAVVGAVRSKGWERRALADQKTVGDDGVPLVTAQERQVPTGRWWQGPTRFGPATKVSASLESHRREKEDQRRTKNVKPYIHTCTGTAGA